MSSRSGPLVGIVAGEASGDFLGAGLIAALKRRRPDMRFAGIGGPGMQAAGFDSWFPMEKLSVRGYVEALRHYAGIVSIRRQLVARMRREHPAVFVGIDAPDFNLSLETSLRRAGVPTVHYVGPSLWAWRGWRMKHVARAASKVLVLFPFEQAIYEKAGVPVSYVGHPLADIIPESDQTSAAREQLKVIPGRPVVTLMPGSRESELRYMAADFVKTAKMLEQRRPDIQFLVPLVSRRTREIFEAALYEQGATDLPVSILFGHARTAIAAADAVLVASGTATLEVGLHGKPMVIAYRMSPTTWRLMRRMRYQPWVGLPNIIAGRFVVPELLQDDASPENLAQAVLNCLTDPVVRTRVPGELAGLHRLLKQDAAERAADEVLRCLST